MLTMQSIIIVFSRSLKDESESCISGEFQEA